MMFYGMSKKETEEAMTTVPEEAHERDTVAEWRLSECIRIVGLDHAQEFAMSGVDLHRLEKMARSNCSFALMREILL